MDIPATQLVESAKIAYPGLDIKFKDAKHPWHIRALFWAASRLNDKFMTSYATTIGRTIYFPSEVNYRYDSSMTFVTLAHEIVHVHDMQKDGVILFALKYMFPQILALLGLLGFLGFAWAPLFALFGFFIAAAPWPARWRARYERRGYLATIFATTLIGRPVNASYIAQQFTGRAYYWMHRSEREIEQWVHEQARNTWATLASVQTLDLPYQLMYNSFKRLPTNRSRT